jgi:hypothetical protein
VSRRGVAVLAAAVAGVLVVLWAIARVAPGPRGPRSSSYATAPAGLAAYASLLERSGSAVRRLRRPVRERPPATGETLVVLDPDVIEPAEGKAIGAWVRAGGRLLAGGARDASWLSEVLPRPPRWGPAPAGDAHVLVPVPETAGVRRVRTAEGGGWERLRGALPVVGPARAPLVVVARRGRGAVVLLGDASPLQNRLLAQADDAALGLDLAGGRPVAFLETVHGYGVARGLAGLPAQVRWALLGLLLAGLLAIWSAGRRLGPPEDDERPPPPPRIEYVDALASALARTASAEELQAAAERAEDRA